MFGNCGFKDYFIFKKQHYFIIKILLETKKAIKNGQKQGQKKEG